MVIFHLFGDMKLKRRLQFQIFLCAKGLALFIIIQIKVSHHIPQDIFIEIRLILTHHIGHRDNFPHIVQRRLMLSILKSQRNPPMFWRLNGLLHMTLLRLFLKSQKLVKIILKNRQLVIILNHRGFKGVHALVFPRFQIEKFLDFEQGFGFIQVNLIIRLIGNLRSI